MATADSPVQRTAAEHLAHLLKALGPLFKLPTRASNSSQTPTLAALRAFVDLAPDALAALDDVLPAGEEPDNAARSAPYQRELTRASGWIALWAVVRIDDLIREDEASAPPGGAFATQLCFSSAGPALRGSLWPCSCVGRPSLISARSTPFPRARPLASRPELPRLDGAAAYAPALAHDGPVPPAVVRRRLPGAGAQALVGEHQHD